MQGKRAVVTGASEGIGRELCVGLAREGYEVIAVARNEGRLKELTLSLLGSGHSYLVADLSTTRGIEAVARTMRERPVDLLVNNAGYGLAGRFDSCDVSAVEQMMRLNCHAVVSLSRSFLATARRGDALINVGSMVGNFPSPSIGTYAATKAFVNSFTESLWYEQKERGIYVMNLSPGGTATEFDARSGQDNSKLPRFLIQTPEQVAAMALSALKLRRSPVVLTGWINRWITRLLKALPRGWAVTIMGHTQPIVAYGKQT